MFLLVSICMPPLLIALADEHPGPQGPSRQKPKIPFEEEVRRARRSARRWKRAVTAFLTITGNPKNWVGAKSGEEESLF